MTTPQLDEEIQQQLGNLQALAEAAKDSPGRRRLQKLGFI